MPKRNYAKTIQEIRTVYGLNLVEIGQRIKTDPRTVGKWSRGENNPRKVNRNKINKLYRELKQQEKEQDMTQTPARDNQGSLFGSEGVLKELFKDTDNFGCEYNMVELNGVAYTTSRIMAKKFNKEHSNLLKELDRINGKAYQRPARTT